jgi:hypothetical protein
MGKIMKILQILCILGFINHSNAGKSDRPDTKEEDPGKAAHIHFDEGAQTEDPATDKKTEFSSFLKENTENLPVSQEEVEKPESYVIVLSDQEKISSPRGGGFLLLDPKIVDQNPLFPPKEESWWEQWWRLVEEWLFGTRE